MVVIVCHFVASFAALGLPPFFPDLLPGLGDPGARWAGVLYVVPTACVAISAPLWGRLADRYGRKRLLVRAQLGLAVSFWLASLAQTVAQFAAVLVLQGLLGGTFSASHAYLASAMRGPRLASALTAMQFSARAALVVAPIVVAVLSTRAGPQQLYGWFAALPLLAALLVARLPEPTTVVEQETRASEDRVVPLLSAVPLYALEAAFVFATVVSFPYFLLLLRDQVPGVSNAAAGTLFALPHLLFLVAARPALAVLRGGVGAGLVIGFAGVTVGLALHAIPAGAASLVLGRFIFGAGLTAGLVALIVRTAEVAHGRRPGALFGTLEMFSKTGAVVAGVAASLLAPRFGPAAPCLLGALVAATAALVLLWRGRSFIRASVAASHVLPSERNPSSKDFHMTLPMNAAIPLVDDVVTHTLLNCVLRELSLPEGQADVTGNHVVVRLPRADRVLRVRLRRQSRTGSHRFTGPAQVPDGASWRAITSATLVALLEDELGLRTGRPNVELRVQVASSAQAMKALRAARPAEADAPDGDPTEVWLASEQALVHGHRHHPSGKARSGPPATWLAHAPEVGARFPLQRLAVAPEVLRERTASGGVALLGQIAGEAEGWPVLPVHPGQWERLRTDSTVAAALRDGRLVDLGLCGPAVVPTSSVRTVWHPAGGFWKLSLDIRITNCVRRNATYELEGAVALTALLEPMAADLAQQHLGTVLLREPAYRSVDLDGRRDLLASLGSIARESLPDRVLPGLTPLLAAAVADEHARGPWAVRSLLDRLGGGPDAAVAWWDAWVNAVLPPVLSAYFGWGVVLEPHLQNVLVGVDTDGMPKQALLRDLEGTKLIGKRWRDELAGLPEEVAKQISYDAGCGWDRVVYCLIVNHLSEVLGAIADVHPDLEAVLWGRLRAALLHWRSEHGDAPQLRALLSGVPMPGKANLLVRWAQQADRAATYVPVGNPLGGHHVAAAPQRHAVAW